MRTIVILLFANFMAHYAPMVSAKSNPPATYYADYVLPDEVERVDSFWHDFQALNPTNELIPDLNITYEEELEDGAYRVVHLVAEHSLLTSN